MKPIQNAAASLLRRWRRKKVITLAEIMQELQSSVRTIRRRLQIWGALASFNHNSRFYTLPELPQFDEQGLWFHRDIGFSATATFPKRLSPWSSSLPVG